MEYIFHPSKEMVTTANEAAGVSKSAKDVEEIVGLMEERRRFASHSVFRFFQLTKY